LAICLTRLVWGSTYVWDKTVSNYEAVTKSKITGNAKNNFILPKTIFLSMAFGNRSALGS